MSINALGWIPDKPDERDFQARKFVYAALPLPSNYFVYPNTYIYDQGSHPACVGFACAGAKTDEEFLQYHNKYIFNGLWLYQECKKFDGMPSSDGTNYRVALKIMQEQGMRQMGTLCVRRQPDLNWKIGAYFRITSDDGDELIKQIIFQYGTILAGSWWYYNWYTIPEGIFPIPFGKTVGHAWRIAGWRKDEPAGWIVVNSWGKTRWSKDGTAIMPYEMFRAYVLNDGGDVWKLIDA